MKKQTYVFVPQSQFDREKLIEQFKKFVETLEDDRRVFEVSINVSTKNGDDK